MFIVGRQYKDDPPNIDADKQDSLLHWLCNLQRTYSDTVVGMIVLTLTLAL